MVEGGGGRDLVYMDLYIRVMCVYVVFFFFGIR